jgi:CHASE3 domain sensor protein
MKLPSPFVLLNRAILPATLVVALSMPSSSFAQAPSAQAADQDHIVTSQALQQQVQTSSADRQKNIDTVTQFLSTPQADRAMHDAKVDAQQVRSAIPTLSDQELASLSARASNAQQEFAAGHLGPSLLTIIILAIVVIIILAIVR